MPRSSERETRLRLVTAGACVFAALAIVAATVGVLPGDLAIRGQLLSLASPPVIAFMHVVNTLGVWRVLFPSTLMLLLLFPTARQRWWVWLVLMIVAPIVEGTLKHVIRRPRPEDVSFGFPSGHATASAAFFGALIYLAGSLPPLPRAIVRTVAVTLILLVATARVMLRAHWPSDVLGGMVLGLTLASAAALVGWRARA